MVRSYSAARRGFTIVELLVVIAIIGILAGLILPAVQSAREASRRLECLHNQRQIATAVASFAQSKERLPGFQEYYRNRRVSWPVLLLPELDRTPLYDRWGQLDDAADLEALRQLPTGSLASLVSVFYCSSASSPHEDYPENRYVVNAGFAPRSAANAAEAGPFAAAVAKGVTTGGVDYWDAGAKANGLFVDRVAPPAARVRTAQITVRLDNSDVVDGLSNTILLSENRLAPHWAARSVERLSGAPPWGQFLATQSHVPGPASPSRYHLPPVFTWLYADDSPQAIVPPPNPTPRGVPEMAKINGLRGGTPAAVTAELARPSSDHPGGVVAAFADGSTRFLSDGMHYHVYQQIMTPNSSRSLQPNRGYLLQGGDLD